MKTRNRWPKLGSVGVAAAMAAIGGVREALVLLTDGEVKPDKHGPHESDLTGEYNYRTGRLDNGTDPYGWYERD